MSELLDKQVYVLMSVSNRNYAGVMQAHKKCAMKIKERNKERKKKK